MRKRPSAIANRIKKNLKKKNPELLLYLDNPYVDELVNNLIEVIAVELAECASEKELDEIKRPLGGF
jgi:16S rRNA G966 N2-methylase RsmD